MTKADRTKQKQLQSNGGHFAKYWAAKLLFQLKNSLFISVVFKQKIVVLAKWGGAIALLAVNWPPLLRGILVIVQPSGYPSRNIYHRLLDFNYEFRTSSNVEENVSLVEAPWQPFTITSQSPKFLVLLSRCAVA